ncbi:MAG: serine hydrolase domain-containing protein [Gemmatimonadales bacterium]
MIGLILRPLLGAAAVLSLGPQPDGVRPAARVADLGSAMSRALEEEGLVGAVWALVRIDGSVVTGAAGLADAATGRALRASDRVQVGSITKTLLATGVLRLVTERRLALDAKVIDLLPDLGVENRWETTHPLRVRHLLDHTSGLDDARLGHIFSLKATPDTPLRETLSTGRPLRVRHPPGERFSYSNLGFTLLGAIVEVVVGERYESWLDANLLTSLGMTSSTFRFLSQAGPSADSGLAMGHFERGVGQPAVPSYVRPAGQFTTTAEDMARFARFLMSDGTASGQPFIDPRLLSAMGRPEGTEAAAAGLEAGYGLGLARRDRHGVVGRCHDGNVVGYHAMLCLFPAEGKAFFVSHNADSEDANYGRFDQLLIEALAVEPAPAAPVGAFAGSLGDWAGLYVPAPNRFASFGYLDRLFGFASVKVSGQALQLDPFQAEARTLHPAGGTLFRAHDRATISHVVLEGDDGSRVLTSGLLTYRRVSGWHLGLLWISLAAGVFGLLVILALGGYRLAWRGLTRSQSLFVPFLSTVALAIPIPFFFGQSFLALGDLTVASGLLAVATAALPLGMVVGLARRPGRLEAVAMVGVLQWCGVLAVWGLLPLRLWA